MAEAPKAGPPAQGPSSSGAAPRSSSGERLRAVSAARMQPIKAAPLPQGPLSARLKDGAADTALNVFGILRDLVDDFRSSDQFFKYKALIVVAWLALSGATLFVACPGGQGPQNNIGARLVTSRVADTPVFMIVNDSGEEWTDVTVVVNNSFRAAVARVGGAPPDNNLTLEPKKLLGEAGKPAPADLKVMSLVVRTADGEAQLVHNGQNVQ